jgi:L,D-peptidoglycan transpeptidase YkuD (ErfK/YbiS/YcfS/YnhG family)
MIARSLQRRGLTLLRVRTRPGHKTLGILVAGPLAVPVVLGRGGVRADRRYNRPFRRSAAEPGDRLWRDDHLYDFIIEIDHNTRPRVAGRGSAVFLHLARPNGSPTAGCVAFRANDLRRLLTQLGPETRIAIQL